MKNKRPSTREKRFEKNFEELKRRINIKDRYGVFTQGMLEDLLGKVFEERLTPISERLKRLEEKLQKMDINLDWLVGAYKKFDEEHIILTSQVSDMGDRLETVEEKLGISQA